MTRKEGGYNIVNCTPVSFLHMMVQHAIRYGRQTLCRELVGRGLKGWKVRIIGRNMNWAKSQKKTLCRKFYTFSLVIFLRNYQLALKGVN